MPCQDFSMLVVAPWVGVRPSWRIAYSAVVSLHTWEILELLLQGFRDNEWKVALTQIERRTELEATNAASEAEPVLSALHSHTVMVYRQKVERLAAALAHDDEGQREAARSSLRRFIERIEIPAGDGKLMVFGNLGRMLATAAGERDGSMLAAVVECGCGGSKPTVFRVIQRRRLIAPESGVGR